MSGAVSGWVLATRRRSSCRPGGAFYVRLHENAIIHHGGWMKVCTFSKPYREPELSWKPHGAEISATPTGGDGSRKECQA
jgi:hypothetical protein